MRCSRSTQVRRTLSTRCGRRRGVPASAPGHWLEDQPLHPHAFYGHGAEGVAAKRVADNEPLHRALALHADGYARAQIAERLGRQAETITKWMKELRDELGIENDIALGYWATRLGLLDDRPKQP